MKIIMLSSSAHSAGLVYSTITQVNISGVIGEKGTLENIPFRLEAGFKNKTSNISSNKQTLGELSIFVNGVKLETHNNQYNGLFGVMLEDIQLSYIQQWSEKSTIEVLIPYGQNHLCTNHDDSSTSYNKNKKILVFSIKGEFIQSNEKLACKY